LAREGNDEIREDFQIPEDARGLGAIEGNESNLFADRMKDRGMSHSTWARQSNCLSIENWQTGVVVNHWILEHREVLFLLICSTNWMVMERELLSQLLRDHMLPDLVLRC